MILNAIISNYFHFWCFVLGPVAALNLTLVLGNNIQMPCQLLSNLAQVRWRFSDRSLLSDQKYYIYSGGLLILRASESDAGVYSCDSVEEIKGRMYNQTVAVYRLQLHSGTEAGVSSTPGNEATNSSISAHTAAPGLQDLNVTSEDPLSPETLNETVSVTGLEVAVALLSLICLCLLAVLLFHWNQRRWKCLKCVPPLQSQNDIADKEHTCEYMHIPNRSSEVKMLGSDKPYTANNNHTAVDFKRNGEQHFTPRPHISSVGGLGYINDESEI